MAQMVKISFTRISLHWFPFFNHLMPVSLYYLWSWFLPFTQVADSGRHPDLEDYGYVPEEVHEIFDLDMYDEELLWNCVALEI